jgi:hypothetical protein
VAALASIRIKMLDGKILSKSDSGSPIVTPCHPLPA